MHHSPPNSAVGFVRRLADDLTPDADLLRRFVATKDETAFAALVKRHGPAVWRVCRSLVRQPADADDAFQATFLLLMRNANTLRNPAAVGAWLHGTAVNVATKARGKRRPEPLETEPAVVLGDVTVREAEAIFHEELANLPAKFREPLILCCLDSLSRDEAADRLGVTVEAVKHGLERGRELLRARLRKRGIAVSVPLLAGLLSPSASAVPAVSVRAVSAIAVSLADEVSNMTGVNRKVVALLGLFAVAVAAAGVGIGFASDPPKAAPPAEAKAKPADKPVTEISLDDPLTRATTSRDGKVLATVTERPRGKAKPAIVTFWDTVSGERLGTLGEVRNYWPVSIALSPDGSAFAWVYSATRNPDNDIEVYDTKTGELRGSSRGGMVLDGTPSDIQFSPDGKRIVSTFEKTEVNRDTKDITFVGGAAVADVETGETVRWVSGHTRYIVTGGRRQYPTAAAPQFIDGGKRFVTVGRTDKKVIVWSTESGRRERAFDLPGTREVITTAITPDGKKLVTFHENLENVVWDVESGNRELTLADPEGNVLLTGAVSVSGDGKRVAALVDTPKDKLKLKVWDLKSGKLLLTKGNVGPQVVCFDAVGRVAVCDGSLKKIVFHTVPE